MLVNNEIIWCYHSILSDQLAKDRNQSNNVNTSQRNSLFFALGFKFLTFIQCNKQKIKLIFTKMHKYHLVQRDFQSNTSSYTQSFSKMYKNQALAFNLKDLWLRKSFFFPPEGLDESYASRNHIAGADIPIVQIVYSSQRWLLVQTPKFSLNFFKKLNQFKLGNPYQQLLRVLKGFYALTKVFGYFRPTNGMISLERKDIRVWINVDIFSNQPQMKLNAGLQGQKEFVIAFLAMVQIEMVGWERATNINTVQDAIKLIEWRSRIYRGSFTAVNASQKANHLQSQQQNSMNSSELISQTQNIKSCKSAYQIGLKNEENFLQDCLSNSIVIHVEQARQIPKKIHKLFSDQKEEMKYSIYEDNRDLQQEHQVRKTKKKFNLTSTSSTLQKICDKLGTTMRKKTGNKLKVIKQAAQNQKLIQSVVDHEFRQSKKGGLYKSQSINIANELDGLFQQDKMSDLKIGIEGNKQELQKIAEEMEEVLIW